MNTKAKKFGYEFIRYDGNGSAAKTGTCCENGKVITTIPSIDQSGVAYFHSFALTENYIVFVEYSLHVSYINCYTNSAKIVNFIL